MSKNGKLYDYITLGFHLSALVEKCSISRCFVMVQLWKILTESRYVAPYMKGAVRFVYVGIHSQTSALVC
jgi:hypothetical protein